jgi:hypothetical protein
MSEVMVERSYPEPLSDEVLNRNLDAALPCLNLHRVTWRRSFLSLDRKELVCPFSARDAESVRIALQQAGARRGLVWSCRIEDAPGMAEGDVQQAAVYACSASPESDIVSAFEPDALCLVTHRVKTLRRYVSLDRRRLIALYEAPDAESVRLALHGAGLQPEYVRAFSHLLP